MLVSKINSANIGFKSMRHVVNNVGETVQQFNYVYDSDKEICEVEIFRVTPTDKYNYKLNEKPIATIPIKPDGTIVNIQNETDLDKDEAYAYRVVRRDKETNKEIWKGPDSGVNLRQGIGEQLFRIHVGDNWKTGSYVVQNPDGSIVKDENGNPVTKEYHYPTDGYDNPKGFDTYNYTLVTRNGTTPLVQGIGHLAMPDTLMPAMKYKDFDDPNTGEIWEDKEYQKQIENSVKNPMRIYGGGMAGMEAMIPILKERGVKYFFMTPYANGSNVDSHGYTNKNNYQMSPNMGNIENYKSFIRKSFASGVIPVYDATLTSEGLEGVNFQYALRWGENAQTFYWYRINDLKNSNISLGVVPKNAENLRHRIVNSPFKLEQKSDGTYEFKPNDKYDSKKETLIQIYDGSQATEEEMSKLDPSVRRYSNLKAGKELDINTSEDTVTNYVFQISPNEYKSRIDAINDLIKQGKKITVNSSEGTILAAQFSNFKLDKAPGGGVVTWDANADLIKLNYGISGYDETRFQAISDRALREYKQQLQIRGSKEVQDMGTQIGSYQTELVYDTQLLYTAQTIGMIRTTEGIDKLIKDGKLSEETRINNESMQNILNRQYNLSPKGALSKDDVTIKSLMKLPLPALEFGENIQGVLSTSYFTNRATTDETIGMSRFELYKAGNPQLIKEYASVYNNVNNLYNNELKSFADSVLKKVNESSDTKLFDSQGNYTEYGEYVAELLGKDIAKYALLKSLAGESFRVKQLKTGELTYDYDNIRKNTTLRSLGIKGANPEDEANQLYKKIRSGLKNLDGNDIDTVSHSVLAQIRGTSTSSFRIGEALTKKAGLGLSHRLDAIKDTMDTDSVRNRYDDFDDYWNNLIGFCKKYVEAVKSKNEHSYIVAEMTDVADVIRETFGGPDANPYNGQTDLYNKKFNGEPDALTKFFNETGVTSEAAYSYLFTELLNTFSRDFETGKNICESHDAFKHKLDLLMKTRSVDYVRNLYTFIGNHDKARTLHGLATDMKLYYSPLVYMNTGKLADFETNREERLEAARVLSGSATVKEMPLELRLNVDNLDYFRTVSARAAAQTKTLSDAASEVLKGIISDADIKLIKEAFIDLANGNYLENKTTEKMTKINIKELSSIENAARYIAQSSGLSESDISEIANTAENLDYSDYLVHGDFNWGGDYAEIGNKNKEYLKDIMGTDSNSDKYSLYTVQVARIIKKASEGKPYCEAINNSLKAFVQKYDRKYVNDKTDGFKMIETPYFANKKNGYAARDFRDAIKLAIEQAEFKSGKKLSKKDEIENAIYESVTEPALQKHGMILSYLNAMLGIPTLFIGDEYGLTGNEDKTKNKWRRNRGIIPFSKMWDSDNIIGKTMRKYESHTLKAMWAKRHPELSAIKNGTMYEMDVISGDKTRDNYKARIKEIEIKLNDLAAKGLVNSPLYNMLSEEKQFINSELAKVAIMMQGADGEIAVSVFNSGGISHDNRVNYFEKLTKETGIDLNDPQKRKKFFEENNIDSVNFNNPYVPIQKRSEIDAIMLGAGIALPIGTLFINANGNDNLEYIVKQVKNGLGIVRKDGKKIVMDGLTAKNGVMVLRKLSFKGSHNNFYVSKNSIYSKNNEKAKEKLGANLSVIAG